MLSQNNNVMPSIAVNSPSLEQHSISNVEEMHRKDNITPEAGINEVCRDNDSLEEGQQHFQPTKGMRLAIGSTILFFFVSNVLEMALHFFINCYLALTDIKEEVLYLKKSDSVISFISRTLYIMLFISCLPLASLVKTVSDLFASSDALLKMGSLFMQGRRDGLYDIYEMMPNQTWSVLVMSSCIIKIYERYDDMNT